MNLATVPREQRTPLAQSHLNQALPDFLGTLQKLSRSVLDRSVLFVASRIHSREIAVAETARLAGWEPILIYTDAPAVDPGRQFAFHFRFPDQAHQALAMWAFPGPLAHLFTWTGREVAPLISLKHGPTALDIYDTGSGFRPTEPANFLYAPGLAEVEREAIRLADGITHRDLRLTYLERLHGYAVPQPKVFIHDPLTAAMLGRKISRPPGPIRVVSTGSIDSRDGNIVRIVRALCSHGVPVHIYLTPNLSQDNPGLPDIRGLAREFPGLCNPEAHAFGEDYWNHVGRYDFGLGTVDALAFDEPMGGFTDDYLRGCGSSRLTDYIAMGLGLLGSPRLRFQAFLSKRYGQAYVPVTREFLANPRPALETAQEVRLGMRKPLFPLSTSHAARRLGRFYAQLLGRNPA